MEEAYYRLNNAEFLLFLNNLIRVIEANRDNLPVTDEQLEALKMRRNEHEKKLNEQIAAKEAYDATIRNMKDDRPLSNKLVSFWNTDFQNDDSIPRDLIVEMGFKVPGGNTSPPPKQPANLTVKIQANGERDLKWGRNGNKQNTIFVVEEQTEGSSDWTYLVSINGTKFTHKNQKPGVQTAYRVKAARKGEESNYSNVAVAYYKG